MPMSGRCVAEGLGSAGDVSGSYIALPSAVPAAGWRLGLAVDALSQAGVV